MKQYYKIINDEIVFFKNPLIVGESQIFNPTEDMLIEQGWQEYVSPVPTEEELLQEAKLNKIAEIEDYDKSDAVNSFSIGGVDMWLDFNLRQQLRTSIIAYQKLNEQTVTKWFNGVEYTFTTEQWMTMLNTLEVYASEALNVTEAHKAEVNALTSIQDIENYDITLDYPNKLQF